MVNHLSSAGAPLFNKMLKVKQNGNHNSVNSMNSTHPHPPPPASSNRTQSEDEILEVNLISDPENPFSEFLDTGQFSDIVLRCASDGRFIECHRIVLAARAKNFSAFCGHFLVTELVFKGCVKFEHLQALVNLIYRGHINGQDHQITSTLWKLFKIFGVPVTAKCFKGQVNGQRELAHELRYEQVERDVEKGAMKFEKIVQEFRSVARRKVRRSTTTTIATATENSPLLKRTKRSPKKKEAPQPRVIVISDDEQGAWSSASCSSFVSSLSSSSSDCGGAGGGGAAVAVAGEVAKLPQNGKVNAPQSKQQPAENAIKSLRKEQPRVSDLEADNWDSSGSSEGEYVEPRKQVVASESATATAAAIKNGKSTLRGPTYLEYNQNEMSIIVKSIPEGQMKEKTPPVNPVKDTESESIICSPQILFNIKSEPIDEDEVDEMEMAEVNMEQLGIKMEIVDDEENYEPTMHGRRLPPPLLIPLQGNFRKQAIAHGADDKFCLDAMEGELDQSRPPANFPPFILRNPRGNQTRTYTTDNLWAALMDVKSGESIYRASQQHKVPRKTLRNWMKRCQIKSAYPMPSQLKQAAEKKKLQKYSYQ